MFGIKKYEKQPDSGQATVTALDCIRADDLIHEASSLGGLRIWQYRRGDAYQVTISFERRSGSEVEAKAKHSNLVVALSDAIAEARALGAS
jgi:hypothetical protein